MDATERDGQRSGGNPKRVRFTASVLRTPSQVPAGTKFVPGPDTWTHATWQSLRFAITVPMYYSYEIEVSKDGRKALVRAWGDLDGDGVLSCFERTLELTADGNVSLGAQILINNEFE